MLMWILVTATACPVVIWGAIDRWAARTKCQAPRRWPPVTVLYDDASLLVVDEGAEGTALERVAAAREPAE
jgi:hypothetical protein